MLKQPVPRDAGEDSYDLNDILLGHPYKKSLRDATVHHSVSGQFAIRKARWKLIEGGGDGDYPRNEREQMDVKTRNPERDQATGRWLKLDYFQLQPDGQYQLYDLESDPGEKHDLASQRPDKVRELVTLLERYRKDGRSAPLSSNRSRKDSR